MEVTIKERGWAGHFCSANKCRYRRNTLVECGERRIIVSSVGNMFDVDGKGPLEIGSNRFYETMAFEAVKCASYWEVDVSQQLSFTGAWSINSADDADSDNRMDSIHDAAVQYFVGMLENGE